MSHKWNDDTKKIHVQYKVDYIETLFVHIL